VRNREISYISEGRRKKVKERRKFGNGLCNGCNGCNGCQEERRRKKEEGKCNPSNDFSD
jgi:hypothetical protein